MHLAIKNKNTKLILYLIRHGSSLTLKNKEGKYPIDLAVETDDWELVKYLTKLSNILIMKSKLEQEQEQERINKINKSNRKISAQGKPDLFDIDESEDSNIDSDNYEPKSKSIIDDKNKKYTNIEMKYGSKYEKKKRKSKGNNSISNSSVKGNRKLKVVDSSYDDYIEEIENYYNSSNSNYNDLHEINNDSNDEHIKFGRLEGSSSEKNMIRSVVSKYKNDDSGLIENSNSNAYDGNIYDRKNRFFNSNKNKILMYEKKKHHSNSDISSSISEIAMKLKDKRSNFIDEYYNKNKDRNNNDIMKKQSITELSHKEFFTDKESVDYDKTIDRNNKNNKSVMSNISDSKLDKSGALSIDSINFSREDKINDYDNKESKGNKNHEKEYPVSEESDEIENSSGRSNVFEKEYGRNKNKDKIIDKNMNTKDSDYQNNEKNEFVLKDLLSGDDKNRENKYNTKDLNIKDNNSKIQQEKLKKLELIKQQKKEKVQNKINNSTSKNNINTMQRTNEKSEVRVNDTTRKDINYKDYIENNQLKKLSKHELRELEYQKLNRERLKELSTIRESKEKIKHSLIINGKGASKSRSDSKSKREIQYKERKKGKNDNRNEFNHKVMNLVTKKEPLFKDLKKLDKEIKNISSNEIKTSKINLEKSFNYSKHTRNSINDNSGNSGFINTTVEPYLDIEATKLENKLSKLFYYIIFLVRIL